MSLGIEEERKSLALKLFDINAVKFGNFQMKVGVNSPVYFDLRVIVSYPDILESVSRLLVEFIKERQLSANTVCGVPYTALPIATLVSIYQKLPMLVRRKEAKTYGTKKIIEGVYNDGDTCLIIEDVVTSGSSIMETVRDLKTAGLVITDAIVVMDREQGGKENIAHNLIRMHSLFSITYLLRVLLEAGKIPLSTMESVTKYIKTFQINIDGSLLHNDNNRENEDERGKRLLLNFEKRATMTKCLVSKDLFNLMATKKTNLCLAADVTECDALLKLADDCGPYICLLKTHIDIIENFNDNFITKLRTLAKKHQFLILEDRKYADIGNTVSMQHSGGIYKISEWADCVTAHSITGASILQGLRNGRRGHDGTSGVFLLAEMSSKNNLIDNKYKEATIKIATENTNNDFVAGIVGQSCDIDWPPGLIQLTPGIRIDEQMDSSGQQYRTPEVAVKKIGADICVVGRGILEANSTKEAAATYRDRLWAAYIDRVTNVDVH